MNHAEKPARYLKCCLHAHSREFNRYSTLELLHAAANLGYDVVAITEHDEVYFPDGIADMARDLLVLPGIEASVGENGTHVLVLNTPKYPAGRIKTMKDFRSWAEGDAGRDNILVVAPHPFYKRRLCLGNMLEENIDLFDAIEFSHCRYPLCNEPNDSAVDVARRHDSPLLGTPDVHWLWQLGTTYSMIRSGKTAPSLVRTIKNSRFGDCAVESYSQDGFNGSIIVKTRYLTAGELTCVVADAAREILPDFMKKK